MARRFDAIRGILKSWPFRGRHDMTLTEHACAISWASSPSVWAELMETRISRFIASSEHFFFRHQNQKS